MVGVLDAPLPYPQPLGQQICLWRRWMVDSASNQLGWVV